MTAGMLQGLADLAVSRRYARDEEDEVLAQAVIMYDGLKDKKITTALVMFKGEQHGFRTSNAIRRALDGEFFFYGKVLGMPGAKMPDDLEPIPIANL